MKITQAIIPAAGLGTRFLPFTKSVAKELVPIMGKPAIQMVIEEGIASGITTFTIIANPDKQAIIDYLSPDTALENHLKQHNKLSLLDSINKVIAAAQFSYVPQPIPLGLGHAILMAEKNIGNDYCGVFLPDEIMIGNTPALAQLIDIAQRYNASVIAVQEVPKEHTSSYGIVAVKKEIEHNVFEIDHLVEKPTIENAPSRLAIVGRYILSPQIFTALKNIKAGAGNEIQLTDGITEMINNGERVLAYKLNNTRYDIGNPLGLLQANISCALSDPVYASQIKEYIKKIVP